MVIWYIRYLSHLFCKQVSIVGAVYLVGYMQWSVAWLIGPVFLSVLRDQWRKESEYRRNIAKAAAQSSEKDVVLARLDDLPAWVRKLFLRVINKQKKNIQRDDDSLHCDSLIKFFETNLLYIFIVNCGGYRFDPRLNNRLH